MRVSSGTPSIQTLKAQQAWEARRMRQAAQQTQATEAFRQPATSKPAETKTVTDEPLSATPPISQGQWSQTVEEVQSIAQRAGYIGVTEQDIRRAYTLGESLLADYRV